jgi:hypothetical protein
MHAVTRRDRAILVDDAAATQGAIHAAVPAAVNACFRAVQNAIGAGRGLTLAFGIADAARAHRALGQRSLDARALAARHQPAGGCSRTIRLVTAPCFTRLPTGPALGGSGASGLRRAAAPRSLRASGRAALGCSGASGLRRAAARGRPGTAPTSFPCRRPRRCLRPPILRPPIPRQHHPREGC